ncbi:TatD DNase family protein [Rhodoferax sp. OV413]|uniref:Qat anti-phage system TatD family nuclease QatD n=1 Tax=Rhodoferax sp. OV413 TaxID=1855285 RepID=UPI000883C0BD|nr:Qat anti-phage system TatD family nuclease QatD [Rhodoferax sp. OV413]SDP92975.1 TatD DNase family protein [Rhodoferax sp. OV413]
MDFHCHLDLYPNAREVYKEACRRNSFTWLVTTSPKAFAATSRALEPSTNVLITPGLHPEIAYERSHELDLLLEQIVTSPAVGEVGLDGSSRFKATYDVQRKIFSAVVAQCANLGGRVLSIHSRQAVKDVLTELSLHPQFGTAVLHWFSGTASELKAAEAKGCWFSVGPAMFNSMSGRALAAKLPRDRVIPESDGPFAQMDKTPVMPWCMPITAQLLADAWDISFTDAHLTLERNSLKMLDILR